MTPLIRYSLIVLTCLLLSAVPSSAQNGKIGTVDVKKVFDGYWKTKQANNKLKDDAGEVDKQRKSIVDDLRKLKEDYDKLLETASDQAVSAEEREKRKKAAESKLLELKASDESLRQFDRVATTRLGEKERSLKEKILAEIRDAISSRAKNGGYSIIVDTAAESISGTPIIPYTDGKSDITDEVLNQLNSTAPAGALKPDDGKGEPGKEEKK